MKANIIYWSGTGNTEKMAQLICEGVKSAGFNVVLKEVSEATSEDAKDCDVLFLGCSSMGDEVLEETEFEPYMISIDSIISDKKVALFGSYGWGDGEWMRNWQERVKKDGANLFDEGLIINETPSGDDEDKCREFGKNAVK